MPASPSPLIDAGPLLAAHAALWAQLDRFFPASHFARADVPARISRKGWDRLLRRTPWVGLCWLGVAPQANNGRVFQGRSRWTVFLAARNEHAPAARTTGAATGPGLLGMTQVAVFAFSGFSAPGVGTVTLGEATNLTADEWDDEAAAIAGIPVDLPCGIGGEDGISADDLDEFLRAGATWFFDPLPPGGPAAASDTIEVRS